MANKLLSNEKIRTLEDRNKAGFVRQMLSLAIDPPETADETLRKLWLRAVYSELFGKET